MARNKKSMARNTNRNTARDAAWNTTRNTGRNAGRDAAWNTTRNTGRNTGRNKSKIWGLILLITGILGLVLLTLLTVKHLSFGRPETASPSDETPQEERPMTEATAMPIPVPTGSSELQDYYASHPREEAADEAVKEEDEGYEYYTRPDGSHWKKDSGNADILGDAKKGTNTFRQEIAGVPSGYATNLHVEFWESSVGFTGYQMKGNNLYLYGISPDDTLRFERHDNGVWMFHKHKVFLLKETDSDLPFTEVNPNS